eukprot:TRINITY_DN7036_c0_g3_i1.p1 TRINITY_DN7036_c0_g3~~TRINITY_DN7036_c0_g3_i1.p1  ORF type:complete len:282 (+),score=27.76 TRINITY_DN7036_c0_g3_i1:40-846(+)
MDTFMLPEVAMYLPMEDVARWRAADLATKETFDIEGDENVWRCCAQNTFGDRLFATYGLYESSQRKSCFKFHSMLSRANYMMSSEPLLVFDLDEASLIDRRLRHAVSVCSAHRAVSKRDAQVLLGEFDLHDAADGTMFRFGEDGMPPPIAGLPPGVLEIGMLLDGGALMTCARYGVQNGDHFEEYHQARCVQLTLNVDSAESDTFISYRGVSLTLDGCWRSSRCGCYSENVASNGDVGVLCVLSLLDGAPTGAPPSLTNALNLEFYER